MLSSSKKRDKNEEIDVNAKQMTIAKINVKVNQKNKTDFDTLINSLKKDIRQGHHCNKTGDGKEANVEHIFQDKKLIEEESFDEAFLNYKEDAFSQWDFLTP